MNRRAAIQGILCALGACGSSAFVHGCRVHGSRLRNDRNGSTGLRIDPSFARTAIEWLRDGDSARRSALLAHPALEALLRHRRISRDLEVTREGLLDSLLASTRRSDPDFRVLDYWAGREEELAECVDSAKAYLPEGSAFVGTAYLVTGYDIAVASPPDIALNVAFKRFQTSPRELGPIAAHEAHHIGFIAARPQSRPADLKDPRALREKIRYATQLEGMAVHAAYPVRARLGDLTTDKDYRIYTDAAYGKQVMVRYRQLVREVETASSLTDSGLETILEAMSSGERIWYQFGALVAWRLELSQGRAALVASIANPSLFDAVATSMLGEVG